MRSVRVFPSAHVVAAVVLSALLAGCNGSPTAPSNNAPFTRTDLRAGTGTDAAAGNGVTVHYTGWLFNADRPEQKGPQFDSSAGGSPFSFVLGVGQVIAGWDQGLVGMREGGVRRIVIPPSLGYGTVRNGPIPPNATLLFEVELLQVQ